MGRFRATRGVASRLLYTLTVFSSLLGSLRCVVSGQAQGLSYSFELFWSCVPVCCGGVSQPFSLLVIPGIQPAGITELPLA